MRVVVVTPRFPPALGGAEEYAAWTARTLAARGHEVAVVTTHPGKGMKEHAYAGVPVFRLGTWMTVANTPLNPLWAAQLRRLLQRLRPDVVNAHAPVPGLADLAAFTGTVPVVLTYHAGSMQKGLAGQDRLIRWYESAILPRVFARSAGLIAVSPVSLAARTGRASLIPPGVDTDTFYPAEASTGRGRSVLYAGRMERTSRWKGLSVLFEAVARLAGPLPDLCLDMVGEGDDVPHLQALAETLGIGAQVRWHGRLSRGELRSRYQSAGVTVLPSLTEAESFGMTLIEAMACGSPVVGSRVGGVPFVIRDGIDGLLVPPGDSRALAEAIHRAVEERDLGRRLGSAGREAAVQQWDWRRHEDALVKAIAGAAAHAEEERV